MADEVMWPEDDAPGAPGISPTWTSSAKDLVGTSLGGGRIWFTLGFGIVNEIYYPRVDLPQIRDLGFIVADDAGFWCEVKRLKSYRLDLSAPGIPAPTIVHRHPRFELTLRVVPDPHRDVLLIEVKLSGDDALKPYVLLAPHLGGTGQRNIAAVGRHYGRQVLWAEQGPFGLALAAVNLSQADAFGRLSAGYVGFSDGWQDFDRNGVMAWTHPRAGPGNVALSGELPRDCVLALGCGASRGAAASLAVAALAQPFAQPWSEQVNAWRKWQGECHAASPVAGLGCALDAQFATSRMVLRSHIDKTHPGALVASLSIPWGNTKDDRGGYHLVWPRDLVECATALLGAGGVPEARNVLRYLIATQYEDGHWNQNQWLGGTPFWHGVQLDEAALPVLLAALLHERGALSGIEVVDLTRRALGFLVRMGPVTDQDRWEEDRGINAFTLAVSIAALVAGAQFLDGAEKAAALDSADDWNARIESWLFAQHTVLAAQSAVAGHYVRVAPAEILRNPAALQAVLPIKNRQPDPGLKAAAQISVDFLQLVRFGLRAPTDRHVRDSVTVADALLRVDTPAGPAWHRYNGDGYGEHADGTAYNGSGEGRVWPLLTGERGHYELLAGNDAQPYLAAMGAMAGPSGMLPEQVWDSAPLVEQGLLPGKATGSAMPLAWTHAEFIKLALSIQGGKTFDCPHSVFERYRGEIPRPPRSVWSERSPVWDFLVGTDVRVNMSSAGLIRWRTDRNGDWHDLATAPSLPGVHSAILTTRSLAVGERLAFSFQPNDSTQARSSWEVVAR